MRVFVPPKDIWPHLRKGLAKLEFLGGIARRRSGRTARRVGSSLASASPPASPRRQPLSSSRRSGGGGGGSPRRRRASARGAPSRGRPPTRPRRATGAAHAAQRIVV
eukprot:1810549-Lingulodinium_polyedra.AAC.1